MHVFFLWAPSVSLALSRIKGRVLEGGHDVPELVARRRFDRSTRNFLVQYRQLADSWILFDNSGETPAVIAFEKEGKLRIINLEVYKAMLTQYDKP
ncbi:MAG: hypothetical protein ACRD18_06950 [Terriglobia bacterium]